MTHRPERIARALKLEALGLTATEASREIGVPRATVRDWFAGQVPAIATRAGGSCEHCDGPLHNFDELAAPYAYLLGLYLGDGCISPHPRRVFKLRVFLDVAYPGIIEECREAMRVVLPPAHAVGAVAKDGCREVYSFWKGWPCLFPQHGRGKKHERPIVLAPWQD